MNADFMFENIEAIWIEIRQCGTKYLVSCTYRPPFTTTEYYDKIVDRFECAGMTEHPVISLGNLNSITFWMRLYLLIQSTILKLHMICTSWLTNQHEWMIKPPLCWMSFLRPIQHFIVRVQFLYTYWPLSYLHSYGIKKTPEADHITVKFRDMKHFDKESFSNDLISCDILNRFQDNNDISWERWQLAYTDICDKHGPMKSLKLKTTDQIHEWSMIS